MHGRVVIIIVVGLQTLTESHRDYDPAVPTITNGREWKHSYFMVSLNFYDKISVTYNKPIASRVPRLMFLDIVFFL